VYPTTSSAKIALRVGEKQVFEEKDVITGCPYLESQSAAIFASLKMWMMSKLIPWVCYICMSLIIFDICQGIWIFPFSAWITILLLPSIAIFLDIPESLLVVRFVMLSFLQLKEMYHRNSLLLPLQLSHPIPDDEASCCWWVDKWSIKIEFDESWWWGMPPYHMK